MAVPNEEKKYMFDKEKWKRNNLYWIFGSLILAIVAFSVMLDTLKSQHWRLDLIWSNPIPPIIWRMIEITFVLYLIAKLKERMDKIDQNFLNLKQSNDLGRGTMVFSKVFLYISLLFFLIEISLNILYLLVFKNMPVY